MSNTDRKYIQEMLMAQIKDARDCHAYLFCGPLGCGKLICAKQFAKDKLANDSFNNRIDNDVHPDVKIYEPKGVSTYLTNQIKEIIKDSSLAPIQANCKIYIIKHAEKLGTSASNAFLKTLEEPPKNVCFILLASSDDAVLPTIVSRCQVIQFSQIPKEKQIDYVIKNSGSSKEDASLAVELYGGDLEKCVLFCLNQDLQDFIGLIDDVLQSLDQMTDWQTLVQCQLINNKIKKIVEQYQESLEQKTEELSEVLENSAIALIEEQNKRNVSSKTVELYNLLCDYIMMNFKNQLIDIPEQDFWIKRINLISKMSEDLSYNINKQNFCDVLFLNLKRVK